MIRKIRIKNFKRFEDIEFDLDSVVVFVGPNNCGKTTALQAIYLWELGFSAWKSHLAIKPKSKRTTGLTINRKDILAIPNSHAIQLWKSYNVRKGVERGKTENINIEVIANGEDNNQKWTIGFEFIYGNQESIYCRVLNTQETDSDINSYQQILNTYEKVGYLPPMSGLSSTEDRLEMGSINARIGEGQTAQVLRNLCWTLFNDTQPENSGKWEQLKYLIKELFLVDLQSPTYNAINGKIDLTYKEHDKELNILNSGRGFLQILLIFSFILSHDSSILLIDEPDAHLEIIRQQEIYRRISEYIQLNNSQLLIASHSEAILNQAKEKDIIIAFLGKKPKQIQNTLPILKSLKEIPYSDYIIAEEKKWVLYLEGETDLRLLISFARVLDHPVLPYLNNIFTHFISTNQPNLARSNFYGLKEAVPNILGISIFDNSPEIKIDTQGELLETKWARREIENYIPIPEVLERYINSKFHQDLFSDYPKVFKDIYESYIPPIALKNKTDSWWNRTKITDEFLDIIFKEFSKIINYPVNILYKSNYNILISFAQPEEIDPEVKEKLDAIYKVARKAEEIIQSEE